MNLKKHSLESKTVLKRDKNNKKKSNAKIHLASMNLEESDNGVVNKDGCDKCDFKATDQFSLLLHKSTKNPTYILNSQPEVMTGPLH